MPLRVCSLVTIDGSFQRWKGGGGFENGYEVMDSAAREKIWLRAPRLHFSIIQLREVKGNVLEAKDVKGTRPWLLFLESRGDLQ